MTTIIDPNELKQARAEGLKELEKTTRLLAKKSPRPSDRQAMAEIEDILRRTREQWAEQGLVAA